MPTDPLPLVNALLRWPDPPPHDDRWVHKVCILAEYAAALKDVLAIRTAQYRARYQGVTRDTRREDELREALGRVERIEGAMGLREDGS